MREIILDTETTGLDPKKGHRIIEIGCVELMNRRPTGNDYHVYINPKRSIPKASMSVHGITEDFLIGKPFFGEICREFLDYIKEDPLVIHNASFDMRFLNHELTLLSKPQIEKNPIIDTLTIAKSKFPGSRASLDALCDRFGIDLTKRSKHGALLDAELLAKVYVEMIEEKQKKLQFGVEKKRPKLSTKRPSFPKRSFPASNSEISAHKDFVKMIQHPIWEKIPY